MFDKLLSLAFAAALLHASSVTAPARAQEQGPTEVARLEKLKKKVGRLAKNRRAKARVKLKDGRKLRGRIAEVSEDYFVVVSSETRTATTVRYPEVEELKESRPSRIPFLVGMAGIFCLITIPLLVSGPT